MRPLVSLLAVLSALAACSDSSTGGTTAVDFGQPPNGGGTVVDAGPDLGVPGLDAAHVDPPDTGEPVDTGVLTGPPVVERVTGGLVNPWAIDFLPDGRAVVTERPGRMRILEASGTLSEPLAGVPQVYARGQGGLLDVLVSPSFDTDRTLFFCYAAADGNLTGTEVARAQLGSGRLESVQVIFQVDPKTANGNNHYGCRLAIDGSGYLFIGVGDRFGLLDQAQNLENHLGKVMRLWPDGTVPADNPYVDRAGAKPEIYSYGHRNIQGMTIHPETREVWLSEHGPRGGDEINRPQPSSNYGWPLACYGSHYDGRDIPDDHADRGFVEPIHFWNPSIATAGIAFYDGDLFPEWRGRLLVSALGFQHLAWLELDGETVTDEGRLLQETNRRIRDVAVGPEGAIYVVTDHSSGEIYRITREP